MNILKKFVNWIKSSDDLEKDDYLPYIEKPLVVVPPPKKKVNPSQFFDLNLKRKEQIEWLEEGARLVILKSYKFEDLGKTVIVKLDKAIFDKYDMELICEDSTNYTKYYNFYCGFLADEYNSYCLEEDLPKYQNEKFKPFRLVSLMLKVIHDLYPGYQIFRKFDYEYVTDRLAFDVINGGPALRLWIENKNQGVRDLEGQLLVDEKSWKKEMKK